MPLLKKTPLNRVHHELGARMTEFAGWELPVWYTSILAEHRVVRSQAGLFDVSHMGRIWISGKEAGDFLDKVLTRSAKRLPVGSSQICLLCSEGGGILDDLCLYRLEVNQYLLVWNAGNPERKLDWLLRWSESFAVVIEDRSLDTVMLAIQGPAAVQLEPLRPFSGLPHFGHVQARMGGKEVLISRTGYTGEDGFELISEVSNALPLWELFLKQGVKPCGLGARDSLRLEAGLLLYGQDMDAHTNPFEVGLERLVDLDRDDFVGQEALLEARCQGVRRKLIGFRLEGREIARPGYKILKSGREVGAVTSGGYAPSLGLSVGLGYVPSELATVGTSIEIAVRRKVVRARVVERRFYRGRSG